MQQQSAIKGRTIAWKFEDGPTAGKRFEHDFHDDGSVSYRMFGSEKETTEKHYECVQLGDELFLVTYRASSGWTLTSVLDFDTGKIVSIASNEKQLFVQHGAFDVIAKHAA